MAMQPQVEQAVNGHAPANGRLTPQMEMALTQREARQMTQSVAREAMMMMAAMKECMAPHEELFRSIDRNFRPSDTEYGITETYEWEFEVDE